MFFWIGYPNLEQHILFKAHRKKSETHVHELQGTYHSDFGGDHNYCTYDEKLERPLFCFQD